MPYCSCDVTLTKQGALWVRFMLCGPGKSPSAFSQTTHKSYPIAHYSGKQGHINGLAQNCSNSSANILELLQFCAKSLICLLWVQSLIDVLPLLLPHSTWYVISMGYCKKDVTPLLKHWSYVFLALAHRYCTMLHQKSTAHIVYKLNLFRYISTGAVI